MATMRETAETNEQRREAAIAAIDRARRTPVVVSRSHQRAPGRTRFSFRPTLRVSQPISIGDLVRQARPTGDPVREP